MNSVLCVSTRVTLPRNRLSMAYKKVDRPPMFSQRLQAPLQNWISTRSRASDTRVVFFLRLAFLLPQHARNSAMHLDHAVFKPLQHEREFTIGWAPPLDVHHAVSARLLGLNICTIQIRTSAVLRQPTVTVEATSSWTAIHSAWVACNRTPNCECQAANSWWRSWLAGLSQRSEW